MYGIIVFILSIYLLKFKANKTLYLLSFNILIMLDRLGIG